MIGCVFVQLGGHHRGHPVRGYAVVDIEDAWLVLAARWSMSVSGYAYRRIARGQDLYMHRLVLGLPSDDRREGDHINGDRLDNRRSNLRPCTHAENTQNLPARKNRTSAYRGVCWDRARRQWRASFMVGGRHVHVGRFADEHVAAEAGAPSAHPGNASDERGAASRGAGVADRERGMTTPAETVTVELTPLEARALLTVANVWGEMLLTILAEDPEVAEQARSVSVDGTPPLIAAIMKVELAMVVNGVEQ